MADYLNLAAKLTLDSSEYELGLNKAEGRAQTFGSRLKGGLTKVGALAAKGIAAASAAVAGFGATSVKTGMSFDAAMSQVYATMGDKANEAVEYNGKTVSSMEALRDFAQEMGRTTAFSATQASEALNYMALAGYDANKSMEMLPNVLNLAAAGNMDLARASDMVTDAQTAFGINTERTTQMVDEMAKAASTGNTSVEQLGDAFLVVGGLAKELNGGMVTLADGTQKPVDGVQELEIALTAMANAGVKGSEAGTHMRNMLMKLSSPTSDGAERMEELGVKVFDAEGNMRSLHDIMGDLNGALGNLTQEQKIQAIADLFNARDLSSAEALLAAVEQDWDAIGESILDADGAAKEMAATQLDNLSGDVTLFKSALEGAQIAVSDLLTPSLREFVKEGTDGLSAFAERVKAGDLSGAIAGIGQTIANLAVEVVKRVPDMVQAGAQLLTGIGEGLVENFPALAQSAQELVVFLYNSIAENAPAAIQGGAQLLLSVAQGIGDNLPEIMSKATSLVTYLAESLVAQAPTLLQAGMNIVGGLAQGIMDNLPKLAESAINMIKFLGSGLADGIPQFLEQALPMIEKFTGMLRENAGKIVDAGMELILNLAKGIANSIPTLVEHVPQIIINIAGIINDNAPKLIATGIQVVATLVKGIIDALPVIIENIPKIIEAVVSVILAFNWVNLGKSIIEFLTTGIRTLFTAIPQALSDIGHTAIEWLSAINWSTLGADIIDLIVIGIQSLASMVPELLNTIFTTGVTLIKSIDWLEVGAFLIDGLVNGLNGALGLAVDAILGIGNAILNAFKTLFGIASPSTVMEEQGNFLIEGLSNALTALPGAVLGFLTDALNNVIKWGSDLASNGLSAARNFVSNISGTVTRGFGSVVKTITDAGSRIKSGVSSAWDNAKSTIGNVTGNVRSVVSSGWGAARDSVSSAVSNIRDRVSSSFSSARDAVTSMVNNIREKIGNGFSSARDTVFSTFDSIRDTIRGIMDSVGDIVWGAVDSVKDAFDFNWSLPDIELPHFSINWENLGFGVSIPNISVDWWAKGYDNPYLLTEPTVLSGFGDRGARNGGEIVYSHDKLMEDISKAKGGTFAPVINVYTQEGQSNEAIAQYVMDKLTRQYQRAARYV